MTGPQIGYLFVTVLYIATFALFLRTFLWKRYADQKYWRRRPHLTRAGVTAEAARQGKDLPFITLFVPAREEAEVIAATLKHLSQLDYPADRYEIVVITDAKEAEAARAEGRTITTQSVVTAVQAAQAGRTDLPRIVHAEVPVDFDGELGGRCVGEPVRSSKGRALNWGAAFANPASQIYGFYDAESRPNPVVLLHVANRWLTGQPLLLQGPVFQIRNFYKLGPLNKLVALYQCIAHEWNLPVIMKTLPFVGGTNFYVDRGIYHQIGGADAFALTEDLEFGARAYLKTGIWPEYLPVAGSEQTPERFRQFLRQRLRWGSGYLEVMVKYWRHPLTAAGPGRKLMWAFLWKGPVQWIFYQLICLSVPVIWVGIAMGWLDPSVLPDWLLSVMSFTALIYQAFAFWIFFRFRAYIHDEYPLWQRVLGTAQIVLVPLGALFLPLPYTWAMILRVLGKQPKTWVKTPRTAESLAAGGPGVPDARMVSTGAARVTPGLPQQGD
jgi:cellulose synthase/poly-beta-1,6-N-acetylglucosamine synthase-like glycosyltransferase